MAKKNALPPLNPDPPTICEANLGNTGAVKKGPELTFEEKRPSNAGSQDWMSLSAERSWARIEHWQGRSKLLRMGM